jgi:hypothetical protein
MREVNFVPAWYPAVIRQKRLLTIQAWATAIIVVGGLATLLAAHRAGAAANHDLLQSKERAQQMIKKVHELDELLDLQKQLKLKQGIVNELGLPVELSRMVAEMGACAPREITFTEIVALTAEHAPATIAERAAAVAGQRNTVPSRQLQIRLRGIAPTESEVTTFYSKLIQRPCFSQVRLVNSNEKIDVDHKMREFEVGFTINLDPQDSQ